ncbi:hypothetical protein AGOR_G00226710 [Albula goreensis]|uniref:Fibronectin type-III domain-containing protein n=1 Tax=Albula goreensis TaxID=1534307 RepID=A0A8T3CHE4_9TELE|nr:hypothetical protein AGOR_G00226710 [Albula goreensis]
MCHCLEETSLLCGQGGGLGVRGDGGTCLRGAHCDEHFLRRAGAREQREYRAQNMKELCGDCHRLHLSLQGTTGVYLMAYTSQGATDPAPLALPTPCPKLLLSTDFAVVREGWSFNVSWAPLPHLTEDFQYVVQWKEVGFHTTQNFDWINVNWTQRTIIVTGDFRNSTPYNISLFSVATNYRCLLGSTITYILEEVPPEVPGLYISEISSFSVIVTWEHIPLNESRGVIHHYHIGLTNHTEKIVSGDTNSLLFLGLSPSQEYQVWICAESEAGWGPRKYLSFITTRTEADYIIYIVVAMVTVLFLVVILLLFCCSQARVEYLKQLGGCWGKVPDPTNSRLFQQVKSSSGWPGFFSPEESTQRLSQLEVVEVQVPEDDGLPEISPPPEEHNEGWARLGRTQTEVESDKQEEVEKEWTKTIKKGGSEISSEGENYSKMIDTEGGEEDMSWSPTETQDFFSGYEKHFMPSPLEV